MISEAMVSSDDDDDDDDNDNYHSSPLIPDEILVWY